MMARAQKMVLYTDKNPIQAQIIGEDHGMKMAAVLAHEKEAIAIKWPGRSYYGGHGRPRNYASPMTIVYKVHSVKDYPDGMSELVVSKIIEISHARR